MFIYNDTLLCDIVVNRVRFG